MSPCARQLPGHALGRLDRHGQSREPSWVPHAQFENPCEEEENDMWSNRLKTVGAIAVLALWAGCSDTNVIGPTNQLEVANNPGTFEWQVSALDQVTQTLTYSWSNPGTRANVNQSSMLASGAADVRITDSGGAEVYARSLSQNGTFPTTTGASGTWTISVELDGATGTLNFRLETP